MRINATVKGLDLTKSTFRKLPAESRKAIKQSLREGGKRIADAAKQRVPVATGALRKSIGVRNAKKVVGVIVGPKLKYGYVVEHGTEKMPAQPFLRPAADQEGPAAVNHVLQTVKRAIENVGA